MPSRWTSTRGGDLVRAEPPDGGTDVSLQDVWIIRREPMSERREVDLGREGPEQVHIRRPRRTSRVRRVSYGAKPSEGRQPGFWHYVQNHVVERLTDATPTSTASARSTAAARTTP